MRSLKWIIGKVEIQQIIELEEAGKLIQSTFKEATPETVKRISWLYPDFADSKGNLKALVQSFLVKSEGKIILIDTCNGNNKIRSDLQEWGNLKTDFINRLRQTGIKETEIDIVICTHLHCDHVGWNTKLENGSWIPTFTKAKYLFVREEFDYWKQKPEKEMKADKEAFADSVEPIINEALAEIVESDYRVDGNIKLRSTIGHTPGHVSVSIESKGQKALISGDFIHHPIQFVYPFWTMDADVLPEEALKTRQRLFNELADKNILLIGSHFSNPVAGFVEKDRLGYIFKQEF